MILTDEEIIKRLNIGPKDKVLDIGGSMMQHTTINVHTLADIIRPEEAPYGKSQLLAKNYVRVDITKENLPFKNKEFDVCLCTHVLEDLPTPFLVIEEMSRVSKRGLIVTPSMGEDMKFTEIDFTDWLTGARRVPGQAHHKWFFINNKNKLKVIPKLYPILYTNEFQMTEWLGEKEMIYTWKDEIKYEEFSSLNIHDLIDEYKSFFNHNSKKIRTGIVLLFIDNPFNFAKSLLKKILKRGEGYRYRKYI